MVFLFQKYTVFVVLDHLLVEKVRNPHIAVQTKRIKGTEFENGTIWRFCLETQAMDLRF